MDRINILKFLLIALALPAQFFISQFWSYNSTQQNAEIKNLVSTLSKFKETYFSLESWKKWYVSLVSDRPMPYRGAHKQAHQTIQSSKRKEYDDDLALEVLAYRKDLQFGESSKTRNVRPSRVKYRVGQVIKHAKYDLYGVIIGWDEVANAPADWMNRNYVDEFEKTQMADQPHYLILVDEKYQDNFSSKAYIAQNHIEIVVNKKIKHNAVQRYFGNHDGGHYFLKKFLRSIYPHD